MEFWRNLDMKIKVIISVITLCGMLSGIGFSIYNTFAKEVEFKELKSEFIEDKLYRTLDNVQERIWKYEDRYGVNILDSNDIDQLIKDEFRELQKQKEIIKDQLNDKYNK